MQQSELISSYALVHGGVNIWFLERTFPLACPREHRAVVLHAISPISMKLCQFKGSTPKLKNTNRFLFWFFPGGDRPPPPGFSWFLASVA